MKYALRLFLFSLFLMAICLVGLMANTSVHKINRVSDGHYKIVYYPLLGWRLSAAGYYSVAGSANLIVAFGTLILWRKWRVQRPRSK